jgi:MFS family permease
MSYVRTRASSNCLLAVSQQQQPLPPFFCVLLLSPPFSLSVAGMATTIAAAAAEDGAAVSAAPIDSGGLPAPPPELTPEERRQACCKVAIASVGFCLDAYDFFIINIVLHIMGNVYGEATDTEKGFVASMALYGALLGQVLFGVLADKMGRRVIFVTTCILVVLGSLSSSLVWHNPNFSIFWQLGICRFILGLGVGGEYPLSASVANEASKTQSRGRATVIVFSMQGWGALLAPTVSAGVLSSGVSDEVAWRLCLGLAVLPMVVILPFRWRMEESHAFKEVKAQRVEDKKRRSEFADVDGVGSNKVEAGASLLPPSLARLLSLLLSRSLSRPLLASLFLALALAPSSPSSLPQSIKSKTLYFPLLLPLSVSLSLSLARALALSSMNDPHAHTRTTHHSCGVAQQHTTTIALKKKRSLSRRPPVRRR